MKRTGPKEEKGRSVINVPNVVYNRARELSEHASLYGWAAFGIDRRDPPSLGAVIDEGLLLLAERLRKKAKK
jgi:hypothetical protein